MKFSSNWAVLSLGALTLVSQLLVGCGQFKSAARRFSSGYSSADAVKIVDGVARPPDLKIAGRCTPTTPRGSDNRSLRKLTKPELIFTLIDVLDPERRNPNFQRLIPFEPFPYTAPADRPPVQVAINAYPTENVQNPGEDFQSLHTYDQIVGWAEVADVAAEKAVIDKLYYRFAANNCLAAVAPTEACHRELIERLGRRALRRPLSAAEVTIYLDAMIGIVGEAEKIRNLIAHMLMSPDFVFHIESGTPGPSGERIRLSQHEVANRISYRITATLPDEQLAAAADNNQLNTVADVERHVTRLIQTAPAKEKILGFFYDWLRFDRAITPNHLWTAGAGVPYDSAQPNYANNDLDKIMVKEAQNFIKRLVWEPSSTAADAFAKAGTSAFTAARHATFEDLLTHDYTQIENERISAVYFPDNFTVRGIARTPTNPGLLARAAFLAHWDKAPSPIQRGVTVKRRVMCDELPSPDFSVISTRTQELASLDPVLIPNHEITTRVTRGTSCMQCHKSINAIGFLFEHFNPIGRKTLKQQVPLLVYDWPKYGFGELTPELDRYKTGVGMSPTEHLFPGAQTVEIDGANQTFTDPIPFIEQLAKSPQVMNCVSVRLFRHFNRRSETENDSCAVAEPLNMFKSKQPVLDSLIRAVANEDIFWRKPL